MSQHFVLYCFFFQLQMLSDSICASEPFLLGTITNSWTHEAGVEEST